MDITKDVMEVDESQDKSHEMVMSIIVSSNKFSKPKSYEKVVNNLIYSSNGMKP